MAYNLEPVFNPKSIAIIGASGSTQKFKYSERPLRNLIKHGYKGKLYPVNPQYETIHGLTSYKSIKDIPDEVEAAISLLPARYTLDLVKDCAEKGVKVVFILSSGYGELSSEGEKLQNEIVKIGRENNMLIVGPNMNGIISKYYSTIFSWAPVCEKEIKLGNVGIVTQSGNMLSAIVSRLQQKNIGIAFSATGGNEADVGFADYLHYMASHEHVKDIVMFIEAIRKPDDFLKAVEVARKNNKNLYAIKIGKSDASSKAATAHTGALVGSDETYDALFKREGIIRLRDLEEFVCAVSLSEYANNENIDQLGIVAYSGGHSSLVADRCADYNIEIPEFSDLTKSRILEYFNKDKNILNPLDIEAYLPDNKPALKVLSIMAEDDAIGGVVFCVGPLFDGVKEKLAHELNEAQQVFKEKG
ncbi:CoA-binding protein, partial [Neobacillus niacini]|uniref:CoA-binding protein n=1 Tax=Neobacillus niacini TaxID=86668 RepID=UPI00300129B6